jgi:hypothetical protein
MAFCAYAFKAVIFESSLGCAAVGSSLNFSAARTQRVGSSGR